MMSALDQRRHDRALLAQVGEALYGDTWQSALSRALDVEPRAVRRWVSNQNVIPPGVWAQVRELIHKRRGGLMEAEQAVTRKVANV